MTNLTVKKGYYYVIVNYKDDSGKRKQKWIPTGLKEKGNKRKAEQIRKEIDMEYTNNHIDLNKSILFTAFLSEWLETLRVNKSVRENTLHQYKLLVNNSIIPFFAPMKLKLTEVTPIHIQKYYTYLQTRDNMRSKGKGVSSSTVKRHHANISKALNHAVKLNLIAYNPASRIELPKTDRKADMESFYTDEQIRVLLEAIKGTPLYTPTFLCAHLGLRRGEVLGLKWSSVHIDEDGDDSYLTIERTLVDVEGEVVCRPTTKTSTSYRSLYINKSVKQFLIEVKEHQESMKRLLGNGYDDQDFVCTWNDGRFIRPGYITEMFPKTLKKLNIDELPVKSFHSLRHSAASMIINNSNGDITMKELSEFLGHSSITITIDLYSHMQFKGKKKIGNLIGDSLSKSA